MRNRIWPSQKIKPSRPHQLLQTTRSTRFSDQTWILMKTRMILMPFNRLISKIFHWRIHILWLSLISMLCLRRTIKTSLARHHRHSATTISLHHQTSFHCICLNCRPHRKISRRQVIVIFIHCFWLI